MELLQDKLRQMTTEQLVSLVEQLMLQHEDEDDDDVLIKKSDENAQTIDELKRQHQQQFEEYKSQKEQEIQELQAEWQRQLHEQKAESQRLLREQEVKNQRLLDEQEARNQRLLDEREARNQRLLDEQEARNQRLLHEQEVKSQRTIEELQTKTRELQWKIQELLKKLDHVEEKERLDRAARFMKRSEKLQPEAKAVNEATIVRKKRKRRSSCRKTKNELLIDAIRRLFRGVIVTYEPDFARLGLARTDFTFWRDEVTYKLICRPTTLESVRIVNKVFRNKDRIIRGETHDPFPHTVLTPSLAANVVTMKYLLGIPLDRYSSHFKASGYPLSTADLANWVDSTGHLLEPLYDRLGQDLIANSAHVIHADETTLKVIDSKERSKDYMFLYTTSFYDRSIYYYFYNGSRNTDHTVEHLKNFKGYLVCDGYAGYDRLAGADIHIQRCLVHVRRKFHDCLKVLSKTQRSKAKAHHVIILFRDLFQREEAFRRKQLTPSAIKEARNKEDYQKAIKALQNYIDSLEPEPGSLLAAAVQYYNNLKGELFTFLEDGHVDISNNIAERAIRPFAVGRKNWLFAKSLEGARQIGIFYSIIHTAQANGLNVEAYLAYVIENIQRKNIDDLLPYSDSLPDQLYKNSVFFNHPPGKDVPPGS